MSEIVQIFGAGPAGLFAALKLLQNRYPPEKVLIYDVRENFVSRTYIVWLNKRVTALLDEAGCVIPTRTDEVPFETNIGSIIEAGDKGQYAIVEIGILQTMLLEKIKEYGIDVKTIPQGDIHEHIERGARVVLSFGANGWKAASIRLTRPYPRQGVGFSDFGATLVFRRAAYPRDLKEHMISPNSIPSRVFQINYENEIKYYFGRQLTEIEHRDATSPRKTQAQKDAYIASIFLDASYYAYLRESDLSDPIHGKLETRAFKIDFKELNVPQQQMDGNVYYAIGEAAQSAHFFSGSGCNTAILQADALARHLAGLLTSSEYSQLFLEFQRQNRERYRNIASSV